MELAFMPPPEPLHHVASGGLALGAAGSGGGAFSPEPHARRPRHRPLAEDEEFAQLIQRLGSRGPGAAGSEEGGEPGPAGLSLQASGSSGTGSPFAVSSPTGVLSHRASGAGGGKEDATQAQGAEVEALGGLA